MWINERINQRVVHIHVREYNRSDYPKRVCEDLENGYSVFHEDENGNVYEEWLSK